MRRVMLRSKIHRATVTDANLNYTGSLTVDKDLLEASDMLHFEQVQVVNLNNGARFETYLIEGERGSGTVCVNGAAARLVHVGDPIIVFSYVHLDDAQARGWQPKVVLVGERNTEWHVAAADEVL